MNKVYLDTNIFIYIFEKKQPFCNIFLNYYKNNEAIYYTSAFTFGELLVQVYRKKQYDLIGEYEKHLSSFVKEIIVIDQEVSKKYAKIRAEFPTLKKPDALHLACALKKCTIFISNDKDLDKIIIPGLLIKGIQ